MMYSCALWSEAEGGVRGDLDMGPISGDLEAAQLRKIHHVLKAARVKPGNRILEFGGGWGGLAIEVLSISNSPNSLSIFFLIGRAPLWLRSRYLNVVY
jgi:cyclopropane fatty-acyl-phospholipid synthase-like methyltransferase